MPMSPFVSIIVPNFNHEIYLKERLDSIFNQSFTNYEVIILDDASTDNSVAFLNLYKDHPKVSHFIINEDNSGSPFKQWQKGIELAKGEYIWIAESDDYCEPTFLEKLLEGIDVNTGLCYSQTIDVDETGEELLHRIVYTKEFDPNIWKSDFEISGRDFIKRYLLVKNVVPNASGAIFKRNLVTDSFFSDTLLQMRMCGDWFFYVKLCEKGDVRFIAEPLNYFRDHSAVSRNHNTIQRKKRRLLEEAEVRDYFYNKLDLRRQDREHRLLEQWFRLHSYRDALHSDFYSIRYPLKRNFTLFLKFIHFKLRK